jgi:hypothetical protein
MSTKVAIGKERNPSAHGIAIDVSGKASECCRRIEPHVDLRVRVASKRRHDRVRIRPKSAVGERIAGGKHTQDGPFRTSQRDDEKDLLIDLFTRYIDGGG